MTNELFVTLKLFTIINSFQKKYKKDFYLFESKLLIIGEAGAGKTTFARKIKNPGAIMPKPIETTRGIDVYKWNFDVTKDEFPKLEDLKMNKTKFCLNLWDFGGQAIYHGTHQFFFSKNSLYVLLADTQIKSGMKWKAEIKKGLQSAKVAILLISTDFLASDFIDEIELPTLLKASENDGATILPLILKPSLFTKHKELAEFQSVNDPKKPLSKLSG